MNATTKKSTPINATTAEINAFVIARLPAPNAITEQIDTSELDLKLYRSDDSDVKAVYEDNGWAYIDLVDEYGAIVPNARLKITHTSGKSYKIPPAFFAILLARKSTIELGKESQLKQFAEQGSMKARGNSYKFVASQEQLDALHAKNQLQWELDCKAATEKFNLWFGSFQPTAAELKMLWIAFQAGTSLIPLGADVYIRQDISAVDAHVHPLVLDGLELLTSTPDLLGDTLISTRHTFKLV
jgi:hypothetical protein